MKACFSFKHGVKMLVMIYDNSLTIIKKANRTITQQKKITTANSLNALKCNCSKQKKLLWIFSTNNKSRLLKIKKKVG